VRRWRELTCSVCCKKPWRSWLARPKAPGACCDMDFAASSKCFPSKRRRWNVWVRRSAARCANAVVLAELTFCPPQSSDRSCHEWYCRLGDFWARLECGRGIIQDTLIVPCQRQEIGNKALIPDLACPEGASASNFFRSRRICLPSLSGSKLSSQAYCPKSCLALISCSFLFSTSSSLHFAASILDRILEEKIL